MGGHGGRVREGEHGWKCLVLVYENRTKPTEIVLRRERGNKEKRDKSS
jgi:hypothetical protein